MDVPVEAGEPGVAASLLQLVDEVLSRLLLRHLQHQSISAWREAGREGGRARVVPLDCLAKIAMKQFPLYIVGVSP